MSDSISIYCLNNKNNAFKEINIKKPQTYQDLVNELQIRLKLKSILNFKLFYLSANKEKYITNENEYKQSSEIIFIKPNKVIPNKDIHKTEIKVNKNNPIKLENKNEINQNKLSESTFDIYYNELPEEEQEKKDDKYCCCICTLIIKKENPYFCYKCQKLIHSQCLINWDKKQKEKGNELDCPFCKNKLPLNEWNKKLDYKEFIKDEVQNINQINEFKTELHLKTKNINRLSSNYNLLNLQNEEYIYYIKGMLNIIRNVLIKLSEIKQIFQLNINSNLNDLINELSLQFNIEKISPLNYISTIINKEMENLILFITYDKNKPNKEKFNKNNLSIDKNIDFAFYNKKNNHKLNNILFIKNNISFKIDKKIDNHKFKNELYIDNNINFNMHQFNNNLKNYTNKETRNENKTNNIELNEINKDINGRISIIYKINEKSSSLKLFGYNFVKNNKDNCRIIYLDKEYNLVENLETLNDDNIDKEIKIYLIGINNITDFSYMFANCTSLLDIPDLVNCKFENIIGIHYMFYGCLSLNTLPDISNLDLSKVTDISYMFSGCSSLKSLPDISNWKNTENITNMSNIFSGCISLESLPSISKWNTSNVIDMSKAFYDCSKLSYLPDISQWNVHNVIYMNSMFENCSSLSELPNISEWNINNDIDMSKMFLNCKESLEVPKFIGPIRKRRKTKIMKY